MSLIIGCNICSMKKKCPTRPTLSHPKQNKSVADALFPHETHEGLPKSSNYSFNPKYGQPLTIPVTTKVKVQVSIGLHTIVRKMYFTLYRWRHMDFNDGIPSIRY
jgi:hypothetical protein